MVDDPEQPGSQVMEISRTLRGVTERYHLSRRLLATEEARRLDELAGFLQQYFAKPAQFTSGATDTTVFGPASLVEIIFQQGRKGAQVSRYKGLGEMNPDQLWETTLDPEQRTLLQVRIDHEQDAEDAFSTLMGEAVEERRQFIQENALKVANLIFRVPTDGRPGLSQHRYTDQHPQPDAGSLDRHVGAAGDDIYCPYRFRFPVAAGSLSRADRDPRLPSGCGRR